jgi:hypothetical protein
MVVADPTFRHSDASKNQMREIIKGFEEGGKKWNTDAAHALLVEWCEEKGEHACTSEQLKQFRKSLKSKK